MSERPTAEIVAVLRARFDAEGFPIDREAGDRLAEQEAEIARLLVMLGNQVDAYVKLHALRLPCPTCGGTRTIEVEDGWEGSQDTCPDCDDGYLSIADSLAIVKAVFSDGVTYATSKVTRADLIVYLRSVRAEVTP